MTTRALAVAARSVAACVAPLGAQEKVNADVNTKIRQEEQDHSQVMRTLHFFTLAMRDGMVPRFPAGEMPPPPKPAGSAQ
jgi:hypothetical protein